MAYIIRNQTSCVVFNNKKHEITSDFKRASQFKSRQKAANVLLDLIRTQKGWAKEVDSNWFVSEAETVQVIRCHTITSAEEYFAVSQFLESVSTIRERRQQLLEALSIYDKHTQDILHCAEFNNLSASQGYQLYRELRETRIKRRAVKNELKAMQNIDFDKISETILKNTSTDPYYIPRTCNNLKELYQK